MTISSEWAAILLITWLWSYRAWGEVLLKGKVENSTLTVLLGFWLIHFATLRYLGI